MIKKYCKTCKFSKNYIKGLCCNWFYNDNTKRPSWFISPVQEWVPEEHGVFCDVWEPKK